MNKLGLTIDDGLLTLESIGLYKPLLRKARKLCEIASCHNMNQVYVIKILCIRVTIN